MIRAIRANESAYFVVPGPRQLSAGEVRLIEHRETTKPPLSIDQRFPVIFGMMSLHQLARPTGPRPVRFPKDDVTIGRSAYHCLAAS